MIFFFLFQKYFFQISEVFKDDFYRIVNLINKIVSKIYEFFECMLKCEVNNLEYVLFNENYVSLYMWYVMLYIEEYSIR